MKRMYIFRLLNTPNFVYPIPKLKTKIPPIPMAIGQEKGKIHKPETLVVWRSWWIQTPKDCQNVAVVVPKA